MSGAPVVICDARSSRAAHCEDTRSPNPAATKNFKSGSKLLAAAAPSSQNPAVATTMTRTGKHRLATTGSELPSAAVVPLRTSPPPHRMKKYRSEAGDLNVLTLSSGGTILRAWNLPDGQMIWETNFQTSTLSNPRLHVLPNSKMAKDNLVLISAGRWIYAVSSIDGAISWGKGISHDGLEIKQVLQSPENDIVYACYGHKSGPR